MAWLFLVGLLVELTTAQKQVIKGTDFATLRMAETDDHVTDCSGGTDGLLV